MTEKAQDFYLWLFALTDAYTDGLVAHLVRRGFGVQALASTYKTTVMAPDSVAAVIGLRLTITAVADHNGDRSVEPSPAVVREEVCDVLRLLKAKFHGMVVARPCDCCWIASNINLEDVERDAAREAAEQKPN